ncbi:MAG: valine--tRNA ligase [Sedimentisphaerales bacterium]|nr:valine--tRNA ligase [Sedimentisphaerales bacterium]
MAEELSKVYEPRIIEQQANEIWLKGNYFHPDADSSAKSYCIVIPPPNVTAPLHLGHALNNTLQDILIRFKRMQGFNTLWMPGTDHAGIATQTVVEKRILAEENKRRTDFERDEFVGRVQAWKDEYEACILGQLKAMGCSCDWERTRFTMDETCAKAVRANFFKLFKDGLIYRGKRLVNWDPATQTVLADDEVEHETIQGHFWYLKYPLVEPVECVAGVPPAGNNIKSESAGRPDPISVEGMPATQSATQLIEKRQGRYLPHWSAEGTTYAVVFRLADSVPDEVTEKWRLQRQNITERAEQQKRSLTHAEQIELQRLQSEKIESFLDAGHGECLLRDASITEIMDSALKHFDGERYDLIAWAVMPNHVHVIVRPRPGYKLSEIVHSWKSFASKEINRRLARSGSVWMDEYYDHLIRDEKDFRNQINYVLTNPEKAGLQNWTWYGMKKERGRDALDTRGQDARDTARATTIEHVTVATTRPETMLGDTAVAMNPSDPRAKELIGKMVRLPIVGRLIPIIADEHVVLPDANSEDEKAKFSTGFLKVTPAHDPDDWAIGQRHDLPVINVMAPDGSISDKFGWDDAGEDAQFLLGMDRFEAREAIVEWFRTENLLEETREYVHEVGHSYRSHVPIEPYLSDQWYIAVKKPIHDLRITNDEHRFETEERDKVIYIKNTDVPVNSLAGLALGPLLDGRLRFIPERYAKTYQAWLENLRDWPISRQLWWGHRIPVWWCEDCGKTSSGMENVTKCSHCNSNNIKQDEDVLDTWFSSALWPFSTLGWTGNKEQDNKNKLLKTFYPGNVLCTAREIITLWVSRMVMMGQYCVGDIPFSDVYIHAMIQDGEGRKMSKSLGNGIDPLVAIDSHGADAMRFTLSSMTTETQDVRMPVVEMELPDGRKANTSPKFDIGRNFCNKLWNASRFAMMNLEGTEPASFDEGKMTLADRWILSRLARAISDTTKRLENYKFSEPINDLYKFFWNDFCDWYLEWSKPRMEDTEQKPLVQNVLAFVLDQAVRLLHPFIPFITEGIFQKLNEIVPKRKLAGIAEAPPADALVIGKWPARIDKLINDKAEADIEYIQTITRALRDIRSNYNIAPSRQMTASASAPARIAAIINENNHLICRLANLEEISVAEHLEKPENSATAIIEQMQIYLHDAVDTQAETERLQKQKEQTEKQRQGIEKKLANKNFVNKARPQVVEQTREKLKELTEQLEAIEQHLAELQD